MNLVLITAGFSAGACLTVLILYRPPHARDQVADALAGLAMERAADLPDPTDAEVRRMVVASRLASSDRVPFAFATMLLGTALLRCRGAAGVAPSSPRSGPGHNPDATRTPARPDPA